MNIKLRGLIFILVAALVISMCSFAAFAQGDDPADDPESSDETLGDSSTGEIEEGGDVEEKSEEGEEKADEGTDDSEKAEDTDGEKEAEGEDTDGEKEAEGEDTDGEKEAGEEKSGDTEDEDDTEDEGTEDKKEGLSTTGLVFLIVLGAIIVIFFGFFIFRKGFRAKVIKFFREYKSELKKVVWSPKQDVVKNTKVVVITIVIFAVAIGLIDLGLGALIDLVGKIGG